MATVEEYFKNKDADFFNNREKLLEGIDFCNKQLINNPNDAEAYYWKGYCNCSLDREQAIRDFDKALELNPKYILAYLNRGNCYRWLKQYKSAINDFKKSLELETQNPIHSSMIPGIKFNLTGVLVEIREICDENYDTAGDYMREYDWDSAIDELTSSIKEYSAIELIKNEDYFEEIDKESRGWGISILDNFALAYDNRASCYEEIGEFEKALPDVTQAINLATQNKKKGYFHINRAQTYRKMGNYEKAISDLSIAIDLYNKDDDEFDWDGQNKRDLIMAYANRAYCYMKLNEYGKAINDYSELIKLNPDDIRNYGAIASCYQQLKQYGKAIEWYSKIIEMCDEDDNYSFDAYKDRIDCYVAIKDYESAKSDCEYLLDNEEIFEPYAEYNTFDKIEAFYNQLEQLTGNGEYEEDDDEYEEDDDSKMEEYIAETKEKIAVLTRKIEDNPENSMLYILRAGLYQSLYEDNSSKDCMRDLCRAYLIDPALTKKVLTKMIEQCEDEDFKAEYTIILKFVTNLDNLSMSNSEKIEFIEQVLKKSKSMSNSKIDILSLHQNPTQGRKLDL